MVSRRRFYITTPIYYVNDKPHIGHTYCTVMADAAARWHRLRGHEVWFSTGTDENTQKVLPVAARAGRDPKSFVDDMTARWVSTWDALGISYDRFVRTTDPDHVRTAQEIFRRSRANGDIYKKSYRGLYCVGCERFLKESELVDGLCPYHRRPPETVEEENYFFRLSRYQDAVLELLRREDFALPESRRNEMVQFVQAGLEDVSVSRVNQGWGIPVPDDPSQVLYVWFDALTNYLTCLGFGTGRDRTAEFWPEAVHLVGKDIFRFHTVLWPAMLLSAGLPPPKRVFGHGFFTVDGQKIGKSLGNAIDPLELSERYGRDALRFYMLAEIPFGQDADFSPRRLEETYNAALANDYGNLLHRLLNMLERYSGGRVVRPEGPSAFGELIERLQTVCHAAPDLYDHLRFDELIRSCLETVGMANKLIDEQRPWDLAKRNDRRTLDDLLYTLFETLRLVTCLLHPVMPWKTEEVYRQMGFERGFEGIDFESWITFGVTPDGHAVRRGPPVFPRLEPTRQETPMEAPSPTPSPAENAAGVITIDDFRKVELVSAKVLEAGRLEGSDKLLRLRVDTGDRVRTILAGIAAWYAPEQLVGRTIVVVRNLAPRRMRGEVSEGMLLAAKAGESLSLLTLDKELPPGSPVS